MQQATETCASLDYSVGEAGELRAHAAFLHATVNTSFLEAALAKYAVARSLVLVVEHFAIRAKAKHRTDLFLCAFRTPAVFPQRHLMFGKVSLSVYTGRLLLRCCGRYPGPVALLCVQLPDPRLKKNMKRRGTKKLTLERIVQPALASAVARRMNTGGLVYFSSECVHPHLLLLVLAWDFSVCIVSQSCPRSLTD